MINHIRTLLNNVSEGDRQDQAYGTELIGHDFVSRAIPGPLAPLYRLLFGANPDQYLKNYRLYQLLKMVHASRLEEYITKRDSRITYDIRHNPFADKTIYDPYVDLQGNVSGNAYNCYVLGAEVAPDATGVSNQLFTVKVSSDGSVLAVNETLRRSNTHTYAFNGLSDLWELPGSSLTFRVNTPTVTLGSEPLFVVKKLTEPSRNIGSIAATLKQLGDETMQALFSGDDPDVAAFKSTYEKHYDVIHKVSAATLALAYQLEDM